MTQPTCESIGPLLSALLDNQLSETERQTIERHLRDCPACRERLADYLRIRAAIQGLPAPEPPADLARRLWERLDREPDPTTEPGPVDPQTVPDQQHP